MFQLEQLPLLVAEVRVLATLELHPLPNQLLRQRP